MRSIGEAPPTAMRPKRSLDPDASPAAYRPQSLTYMRANGLFDRMHRRTRAGHPYSSTPAGFAC
jgi:hypothetical protein